MVVLKEIGSQVGNQIIYLAHKPKEVIRGELYRSGQLPPDKFYDFCENNGIKSVFNLRGENPGKKWFEEEREICENLKIDLYNIKFSSKLNLKNEEDREKIVEFLSLSDHCRDRKLFHCEGGVHRTGVATSFYLLRRGYPLEEAEKQISIKYGYLRRKRPDLSEFLKSLKKGELAIQELVKISEHMDTANVI